MAQTDPFTLDLFGGTALSSGLGLNATAFAGGFATDPDDGECDPATPAPAMPTLAATPCPRPAAT
ncbi:MAG: class I SAM-dependent methyltransferase, partial [Bacteroidales bacterium]|nr:class I SAM-dependent methyltransferase [Bacteroidales bacterium]